jgi:hypothetical protein
VAISCDSRLRFLGSISCCLSLAVVDGDGSEVALTCSSEISPGVIVLLGSKEFFELCETVASTSAASWDKS